jgi:DnaJ domain
MYAFYCKQKSRSSQLISLYAVLGLDEAAPTNQIEAAYKRLLDALSPDKFKPGAARTQSEKAQLAIDKAHATLIQPELRLLYEQQRAEYLKGEKQGDSRPRLGQLCVASGMISMDQLKDAVDTQVKTGMPLGEVLQEKQFISQAELDGLLLGQEMIDAPSAVTDPLGIRLVSLGLVSDDMVLIVQMENRSQGKTMEELFVRHGWVDAEVLKALMNPA